MQVTSLFHVSIKTGKPEATKRFYQAILGFQEAPRPPFEFPGFWLQMATSYAAVPLHFYTGDAARDADGAVPFGAGAIDHIAFSAHGFEAMRQKCRQHGVPFRERRVPALSLVQLFLYDPNGIQIELNFNEMSEDPGLSIDAGNFPPAGAHWFDVNAYSSWGDG